MTSREFQVANAATTITAIAVTALANTWAAVPVAVVAVTAFVTASRRALRRRRDILRRLDVRPPSHALHDEAVSRMLAGGVPVAYVEFVEALASHRESWALLHARSAVHEEWPL